MKVAIILNSGTPLNRRISADTIICADGGFNRCPKTPDYVIGDFDSACDIPAGIKVIRHETHKNFTDGEAAVMLAANLEADSIDIYGVLGGRYDHTLGNFNIMALATSLGMTIKAKEDNLDIYYGNKIVQFNADKDDLISALPHGGNALIKHADGVEYPLEKLLLTPTSSRGISNVAIGGKVKFEIDSGNLLVFHYLNK
ncbi:MAG: thiamine diphosphokinase [Clostridia bacterium]